MASYTVKAKAFDKVMSICINVIEKTRATDIPNPVTRYKTSTGNMAFNSLRYEDLADGFKYYIDEMIAPYMPCTNEPWISARWKGKKNPNEGWFDNYCIKKAREMETELKAEFE